MENIGLLDIVKFPRGAAKYQVIKVEERAIGPGQLGTFVDLKIVGREQTYEDVEAYRLELVEKGPKKRKGAIPIKTAFQNALLEDEEWMDKMKEIQSKSRVFRYHPSHPNCRSALINIKEKIMKTIIKALNGEKSGVKKTQAMSEDKTIRVSLLSVLKENSSIKALKLGEDALLNSIEINGTEVVLSVAKGSVETEKED